MKKTAIGSVLLFIGLIFIGCTTLRENRKSAGISRQQLFTDVDKNANVIPTLFWAHYDATQRGGVYLVSGNGAVKVISENPPDAAISTTINSVLTANVFQKVDASLKLDVIKAMSELGQRNAANYMIRDIAFRIEALKNNGGGEIDSKTVELYLALMKTAENISVAEAQSDGKKYEAQMKASEVELAKMQFKLDSLKKILDSKTKPSDNNGEIANPKSSAEPKTSTTDIPKSETSTEPKKTTDIVTPKKEKK